jgi:hypothetical protein
LETPYTGEARALGNHYNSPDMSWMRIRTVTLVVCLAALVTGGCGSDSSGEDTTVAASVPTVTSPLETASTPSTTAPGKKGGGQTTPSSGGVSPGDCAIPDAFQNFKFTGVGCTDAVAVAQEWDSMGNECNTVDNPNVDEGYNRTCSVEGYSCTAKRDVKSDGRFVTCTQGGQSIRFTWFPA